MPRDWVYTEKDMIRALQRVAKVLGQSPSGDSDTQKPNRYMAYRRPEEPTTAIAAEHFGGWNAALEAAKLPINSVGKHHKKKYSDDDLLDAVEVMVAEAHPEKLTVRKYQALHPPDFPSDALIRRRLRKSIGRWSEIVEYVGGHAGKGYSTGGGKRPVSAGNEPGGAVGEESS